MTLLKSEFKILGLDIIGIVLLLCIGFSIILFTRTERDISILILFFEIVIPAVGCMASSFLLNLENDKVIELILASRKPIQNILLLRFFLLLSELTLLLFIFTGILNFLYGDISFHTAITAFFPSTLFLASLSIIFSILIKSSIIGSICGMLPWVFEILSRDGLEKYYLFKILCLFGMYFNYESSIINTSKILFLIGSAIAWFGIYLIAGKRERYIL